MRPGGGAGAGRRGSRSELIAEVLAGSWRESPPRPEFRVESLKNVIPLLAGSGAAALAWWKIRHSATASTDSGHELRQAYRTQALQSAVYEDEVKRVFALLRSEGVEPVLVKGWAAARLYPESGLRPTGDIDLLIHPSQHALARRTLWNPARVRRVPTDLLHSEYADSDASRWGEVYARSRLAPLDGAGVRVMGAEDHLSFLCLHLLRHSAYRPVWLCDVAAALESAPADFDWEVALGEGGLRRNWVCCVIDLARRLLGARREDAPEEVRAARAPSWLVAEVLRQWERPTTADHLPRELMAVSLRHPARALPALINRWPDPIRAVVELNQPFDERARLPRQLKAYAVQSAAFLRRPLRRPS